MLSCSGHYIFIVFIVFTVIEDIISTSKSQQALLGLKEVDETSSGGSTTIVLNHDTEMNILLRQTKENLIRAFGLRHNMIEIGDKIRKRKPHKYMTYIAKEYENKYKEGTPLTANTVRGCVDIDHGDKRLADFPHVSFKFDVSELPPNEILIQSELKVLMKHENFGIKTLKNGFFRVTVFGVIPRNKGRNKAEHKHNEFPNLWEITSKTVGTVEGQLERWMTFDISFFVNYITKIRRKHVKIILRVKPLGGTSIDPKLMGINNHLKFETEKGLLVLYSGDDEPVANPQKRSRRDVQYNKNKEGKKRNRDKRKRRKNGKKRRSKKACRRKNMVVHFDKFGWSNFLIQPTTQNLYYCNGNCKYPVPSHIKTSNHATIQSIWHEMKPNSVPVPCCVPDEFEVLPVLSLDGNDRVVFKMKEGLIVKSCACR